MNIVKIIVKFVKIPVDNQLHQTHGLITKWTYNKIKRKERDEKYILLLSVQNEKKIKR